MDVFLLFPIPGGSRLKKESRMLMGSIRLI
jgi:hypothetical protein